VAWAEEQAGTDFEAVQTVGRKNGQRWSLSGKKTWVVNAELAGLMIVLVTLEPGEKSLGLFLVDVHSEQPLKISGDRPRLGMRSAFCNDVELSGVDVTSDSLLGDVDRTAEMVLYGMDVAKTIIAGSAIGLVEGALAQAADHARTREQFGQRLGQFQSIQWKLADMDTELTAARLLTYQAAWSKDAKPTDFRKNAAMCKWFSARAARFLSGEALQVLGTFGLSADAPLERFYRDAKVMELANGTSEFQKMIMVDELEI
jgi:alkylation response protein AidB-like acyl-CoA dehydrogenase